MEILDLLGAHSYYVYATVVVLLILVIIMFIHIYLKPFLPFAKKEKLLVEPNVCTMPKPRGDTEIEALARELNK